VQPARAKAVGIVEAEAVALAKLARCILQFVRTVAMRPRYPSSHVVTSLCIAAIVTSLRELAAIVTEGHAGKFYERGES